MRALRRGRAPVAASWCLLGSMSTFGRLRAHVGAYGLPVGCLQLLVVASAAFRVFCSFRQAAFEVACRLPAGCPRGTGRWRPAGVCARAPGVLTVLPGSERQ